MITLSGCTWQEGLLVARPPIYDALAFAHGPLQQLYPRRAAIIALGYHLFASGRTRDPRFEAWAAVIPGYVDMAVRFAAA